MTDRHEYWAENSPRYPFHAIQTNHISGPATEPERLHTAKHGGFIRVPFPESSPPHVLWGFSTEAHRDAFLADFGGAIHTEGEAP